MAPSLPSPPKRTKVWLRTTRAADGESKILVVGLGSDRDAEVETRQGRAAVASDLDVIDRAPSPITHSSAELNLIVDASGPENDSITSVARPLHDHHDTRYIAAPASPENTCAMWIGLAGAAPRFHAQGHLALMKAVLKPVGGSPLPGVSPSR